MKERLIRSRSYKTSQKVGNENALIAAKPQATQHLTPGRHPGWAARPLPGRLLHLCPPAVVSVVDKQQDLTPEQHQGWVRGDHAAHPCVQALQGVEAALAAVTREESRGSCCDSPEHS